MKVLEVDQWTSTGNINEFMMRGFKLEGVKGGDAEAIRIILGGHAVVKEVSEDMSPPIGNVWFKEGADGELELWKANYDSSD